MCRRKGEDITKEIVLECKEALEVGMKNKEIAEMLNIGSGTVSTIRNGGYDKKFNLERPDTYTTQDAIREKEYLRDELEKMRDEYLRVCSDNKILKELCIKLTMQLMGVSNG